MHLGFRRYAGRNFVARTALNRERHLPYPSMVGARQVGVPLWLGCEFQLLDPACRYLDLAATSNAMRG